VDEELCKHEMVIGTCSICKPQPKEVWKPPLIQATFESVCSVCEQDIGVGQWIMPQREGGPWIHRECRG
jgi:hypothetical protein